MTPVQREAAERYLALLAHFRDRPAMYVAQVLPGSVITFLSAAPISFHCFGMVVPNWGHDDPIRKRVMRRRRLPLCATGPAAVVQRLIPKEKTAEEICTTLIDIEAEVWRLWLDSVPAELALQ